jgi:Spondin_N
MFTRSIAALTLAVAGSHAMAKGDSQSDVPFQAVQFEVSITNLTPGQSFTPQFLATHSDTARLFTLGEPASSELEQLAEGGATGPLTDLYVNISEDVQTVAGLLGPGETATTTIRGRGGLHYLSMAAMLLPTNDTFVGLSDMKLPKKGSVTYMVPAYDAGTEENDQDCANIPGPLCKGQPFSAVATSDEGFVHIGNGFHELGGAALAPNRYDWRNPVARVVVKPIR